MWDVNVEMWSYNAQCRGIRGSPWELWVCDLRCMVWEGFIMETMGVKFLG